MINHSALPLTGTLVLAAAKAGISPSVLKSVRSWLSELLVTQEYAKLGQGGHTNNQVPLRQVFVDLPVIDSLSAIPNHAPRMLFLDKQLSADAINLRNALKIRSAVPELCDESVDDRQVGRKRQGKPPKFGATLLIGGPGQGKSTLGQFVCQLHRAALLKPLEDELNSTQRDLVKSFERSASAKGRRRSSPILRKSPLLPLQIALPEFVAWLATEQPRQENDRTPAILRFLTQLPSAKICNLQAKTLLLLASHMPSLLVLDGFDEVGATEDRENIVIAARELLTALALQNGVAQVIATTRPQGYMGELAHIGIPLTELYLAPLQKDEALAYATKLVETKISGVDDQRKILGRLHEAAEESATQRLLTTPLQVTILTALIQHLGRAPRERWNLFSRYFTFTYEREVERDTYASRLLAEHKSHIECIHARVALLLQVEAERAGGASARMSRARLEEVIEAVLLEDEVEEENRKELIQHIAKAAEQRLVFLVEPEPNSYGFEIRSLQEFMAAWALTSGRDSAIEARLLQIAKAPMFRNVALFAASRLFSEARELRDVLANHVCVSLDNDQDDDLSRITHAGGLLALESLEEGAVLSQPKRARALMERAVGLFSLPPGNEHARLARVVNSDTSAILQEAIERGIGQLKNDQNFTVGAAWVCLVEAVNRGAPWAIELAENCWAHLIEADTDPLIHVCAQLRIPLGEWVTSKIENSAEKFSPEMVINCDKSVSKIANNASWVSRLVRVYGIENRWRRRQRGADFLNVFSPEDSACFSSPCPVPQTIPADWNAWLNAMLFEIEPSATRLATALEAIATGLPIQNWHSLQWRSSWPLSSCLRAADSPDELRSFSRLALSGGLGNTAEWRSAEKAWGTSIDYFSVINNITNDYPWTLQSISQAPPFYSVYAWSLSNRITRQKNAIQINQLLEKANQIFQATQSKKLRESLAEVCLLALQVSSVKISSNLLRIEDWIAVLPAESGYLIPRPKSLSSSIWLNLIDSCNTPESPSWFSEPVAILKSFVESKGHPAVLRVSVLTCDLHAPHFEIDADLRGDITQTLATLTGSTDLQRADIAILKLLVGGINAVDDDRLFQDVSIAAVENQSLWNCLVNILGVANLPAHRIRNLFVKVYSAIGASHPLAAQVIKQLRDIFQTRQTNLDNQSIWNRLDLPQPYPKPPLRPRMDGQIPQQPIWLSCVELRDVGGLHQLKLPLQAPLSNEGQWVVLIGPNGIGKTTILRSLALALRNLKDLTIWPDGTFAKSWRRVDHHSGIEEKPSQIIVTLGDGAVHKTFITSGESLSFSQLPEQEHPRLFPIFAYGCSRGSALGGASRQVKLNDDGPEIATLFNEGADLIHAETWLIQLEGDISKNPRSKAIFSSVIDALKILLDVDALEVIDRQLWVTERGRPKLRFSSLSDGYITNAGWFLDLVARWVDLAERQNASIDSDFLKRMTGLVLIDEVDLHLHPRWQIEFIGRTRKLLPLMSFIVTTHNPLTLVGAKANEIWRLTSEKGRVTATSGTELPMILSGGQLYSRYFGINDIYPDELGRYLQRYSFLSSYAFRDDAEQTELESLQGKLMKAGICPEWEVAPRVNAEHQQSLSGMTTPGEGIERAGK